MRALDRLYISASELSLGKGTLGYTTAGQIEIEANGYEANDCVIYRRISDGYELVSFNRTMASPEFTVPEGFNLVSVGDGAFEGASRLGVKKVVLPYTLKVIGDKAFFASGIEEYCFNSLTAPELRYVYREEGAVKYTPDMQTYTGQFYANFETYLVDYYTKESELTVCYPENATGYGNFVYGKYFGRHITTGIHMTDYTRQARDAIDALLPISTVEGWLSLSPTEENRATVLDFATKLSLARTLYSNVTDEAQRAFLTEGSGDKLTELETLMRSVKKQVGIAVNAKSVTYTGEYKKDYYAGEYFDAAASGLQLVIVYDDGSTEQYTGEITLADNQPLGIYDRSVKVIATVGGRQFTVSVAVSVAERPQDSTSEEQSSESSVESAGQSSIADSSANDDGGFPIGALIPMVVAVVISAAAVVTVIIKRKNIKQ